MCGFCAVMLFLTVLHNNITHKRKCNDMKHEDLWTVVGQG